MATKDELINAGNSLVSSANNAKNQTDKLSEFIENDKGTDVNLGGSAGTVKSLAGIVDELEKKGTGIQPGTSFVGTPVKGNLWFDTNNDIWKIYTGSAWQAIDATASGLIDVATGKILTNKLDIGSGNNQIAVSDLDFGIKASRLNLIKKVDLTNKVYDVVNTAKDLELDGEYNLSNTTNTNYNLKVPQTPITGDLFTINVVEYSGTGVFVLKGEVNNTTDLTLSKASYLNKKMTLKYDGTGWVTRDLGYLIKTDLNDSTKFKAKVKSDVGNTVLLQADGSYKDIDGNVITIGGGSFSRTLLWGSPTSFLNTINSTITLSAPYTDFNGIVVEVGERSSGYTKAHGKSHSIFFAFEDESGNRIRNEAWSAGGHYASVMFRWTSTTTILLGWQIRTNVGITRVFGVNF